MNFVVCIGNVWWPKRVNHKSICQNTKQCLKAETNFQKHKSVYQNTKQFLKAQINLPKHKTVSQNTNQFLKTQISLPKLKTISQNTSQFSWNTNQKTGHLRRDYQREPRFSLLNMATVLQCD